MANVLMKVKSIMQNKSFSQAVKISKLQKALQLKQSMQNLYKFTANTNNKGQKLKQDCKLIKAQFNMQKNNKKAGKKEADHKLKLPKWR